MIEGALITVAVIGVVWNALAAMAHSASSGSYSRGVLLFAIWPLSFLYNWRETLRERRRRPRARSMGLIFALSLSMARLAEGQDCAVSGSLPEGAVFIGYSRTDESALHSAALLRAGVLERYDGRNLSVGLVLYEAVAGAPTTTTIKSVAPYLERLGPDHCEFPAQLAAPTSRRWRIWSTEPLTSLRPASESERDAFRSLRPDCVRQGDPPPGEETCVHPELLAVSDVDSDGNLEYWHSTPYRWDTGLTISERAGASELEVVVAACPGCAD